MILLFYIIRYFASANDPARGEEFAANRRYPGFRTFTRVLTLVRGMTYLGEFLLRIILVYHMAIPQFLVVSPRSSSGEARRRTSAPPAALRRRKRRNGGTTATGAPP